MSGDYGEFYRSLARTLLEAAPVPVAPEQSRDGVAIIEASLKSAAERRTILLA
jgi:hypothetical protein